MTTVAALRLVAALRHYRDTILGLARAQRTGQSLPTPADGLHAIRSARAALFATLAAVEGDLAGLVVVCRHCRRTQEDGHVPTCPVVRIPGGADSFAERAG